MMILKTMMTPRGEETTVTPHLVAARGACLRNKRTDPMIANGRNTNTLSAFCTTQLAINP